MTKAEELAYIQGQRDMAISAAEHLLMGQGIECTVARVAYLERTLKQCQDRLREYFADNEVPWPGDNLYLPDLIEKHLP